jgi:hypothetical protein
MINNNGNLEGNFDVFTWDKVQSIYLDTNYIGGFAQASDDALRVISYMHDYKIPPEP